MTRTARSHKGIVLLFLFLVLSVACSSSEEKAPALGVSPAQLDFGLSEAALGIEVWNAGEGTLRWQVHTEQPWISTAPLEGQTDRGTSPLTVTVDRSGMEPGLHSGEITVASNGGTQEVSVSMRVPGPVLEVDRPLLDFGLESVREELTAANTGTESLRWSVENDAGWIQALPAQGELAPDETVRVTVEIQRTGLIQGSHEARIVIRSDGGDRDVTVRCQVPGPVLAVVPDRIDFGKALSEQEVAITNLGGGLLTWSAEWEAAWVRLDPRAGETVQSQNALLSIDRSLLGPGTHATFLQVQSDGGTESVSVSAEVPSWSTFYLTPDLALATDPGPEGSIYQKRLSRGETVWSRDLGGEGATGTDSFFSLQAASYGADKLEVSLVLEHATGEIILGAATFTIQSDSFQAYEEHFSGEAQEPLPRGERLLLRVETEGTIWIRMGAPAGEASLIRVPFP
jgi:hypothetical protein